MTIRQQFEKRGYSFVWAESAYRCCVRLNGEWIGTYQTKRAYAIPTEIR